MGILDRIIEAFGGGRDAKRGPGVAATPPGPRPAPRPATEGPTSLVLRPATEGPTSLVLREGAPGDLRIATRTYLGSLGPLVGPAVSGTYEPVPGSAGGHVLLRDRAGCGLTVVDAALPPGTDGVSGTLVTASTAAMAALRSAMAVEGAVAKVRVVVADPPFGRPVDDGTYPDVASYQAALDARVYADEDAAPLASERQALAALAAADLVPSPPDPPMPPAPYAPPDPAMAHGGSADSPHDRSTTPADLRGVETSSPHDQAPGPGDPPSWQPSGGAYDR